MARRWLPGCCPFWSPCGGLSLSRENLEDLAEAGPVLPQRPDHPQPGLSLTLLWGLQLGARHRPGEPLHMGWNLPNFGFLLQAVTMVMPRRTADKIIKLPTNQSRRLPSDNGRNRKRVPQVKADLVPSCRRTESRQTDPMCAREGRENPLLGRLHPMSTCAHRHMHTHPLETITTGRRTPAIIGPWMHLGTGAMRLVSERHAPGDPMSRGTQNHRMLRDVPSDPPGVLSSSDRAGGSLGRCESVSVSAVT
ncbi:hypothetical protein HJG60_011434 [Phyllostomus discolor]|uniref:Uncharacterized protein n=1 Tax=Phyllostomus discolor TaxID=89673 RepID=A0A834A7Q2_9CHIR|nr:hypothetical protein HJG60_011434 [Phyllostomus discolor]